MRKVLFLIAVLVFAVAAPVCAANIGGTWTLIQAGPGGEETFDLVIQDNGGSLEVTGEHETLGGLAGTGSLSGSDITMSVTASGPIPTVLVFQGKVTGNKMAGTREIKMDPAPGGAPGGGGQGGAPGGGDQGGAPPAGGQGGAPGGGQGGAPAGGQGSAPDGGMDAGGDLSSLSNAWTAVKK